MWYNEYIFKKFSVHQIIFLVSFVHLLSSVIVQPCTTHRPPPPCSRYFWPRSSRIGWLEIPHDVTGWLPAWLLCSVQRSSALCLWSITACVSRVCCRRWLAGVYRIYRLCKVDRVDHKAEVKGQLSPASRQTVESALPRLLHRMLQNKLLFPFECMYGGWVGGAGCGDCFYHAEQTKI